MRARFLRPSREISRTSSATSCTVRPPIFAFNPFLPEVEPLRTAKRNNVCGDGWLPADHERLTIPGVGSWRIMAGCVVGALGMASFLTLFAPHDPTSSLSGFLALPPYYHLVMGGFAFGAVYMATDPVSAAATETGKWIYGIAIGVLTILIRIWNPAYPEGMMLAILFFNIFAPLIDHFVVRGNIKRRMARAAR